MPTIETTTFSESRLRHFCYQIFKAIDLSDAHAELAADVLLSADLRGIDSHGLARLSGYVRLYEAKRVNPKPHFTIQSDALSACTLNADAALGLVSAPFAMDIAIQKAHQTGIGVVAVQNSNHFGIAAYHALKAIDHQMIGFAMTNASPLVAPTFSSEKLLGTNPMCYVFPSKKYPPVVFDMSTSAASNGKLQVAERLGKPIAEGLLIDQHGRDTTDAADLKTGGAMLGLGSFAQTSSHKGYGFGAIVDILCGVVSGANFASWVPPFVDYLGVEQKLVGKGIGHFVGAMRIDAFRPESDYFEAIDIWIERLKSAKRIDEAQKVIIHGEPEHECFNYRLQNGIPLVGSVVEDLRKLGQKFGVQLDF